MTTQWNNVTVVGCGLIGCSFAQAIRRSGICTRIAGWDTSATVLHKAMRAQIIDEIDDAFAAGDVSEAELIYLAMPVGEIIRFLNKCGRQTRAGAMITDSGSTKVEICRVARECLPPERDFIGGHPVAGSHNSGLEHATPDLFRDAPYVLIDEGNQAKDKSLLKVGETLRLLGAQVILMTPAEHDRAMALLSHVPQLLSSALASTVDQHPCAPSWKQIAGKGYADMTRLAESSWSVWHDILATNATPIGAALDLVISKLSAVKDELESSTAGQPEFQSARALFRRNLNGLG